MLVQDLQELANNAFNSMPQENAKDIKDFISSLKASQLKENALKIGDSIKNFELLNIYDEKIKIKSLIKNDYLLINFYRGGWCPFCILELKEYERLKNEFEKNSIDIVAISPEVSKYSIETKKDNSLSFEVLCDEDAKVMKEFGITFTLNDEIKKLYDGFGIDLIKQNKNENFELPVPATYVINKDLEIVFSHIEEDYTTRFEASKILDFIKSL